MTTSATTSLGSRRKRCETEIFTQKWAEGVYFQIFRFANHLPKCTAMVMATGAEGGVTEEERKEGKSERPKGSDNSEGYCVLSLFQLCELINLRVIVY